MTVPEGLALVRLPSAASPPPETTSPHVASLLGTFAGGEFVLAWRATGGPAGGYVVERVDPQGTVMRRWELDADAREYRDGPADAIRGVRRYRVTALDAEGSPAHHDQVEVRFRASFSTGEPFQGSFTIGYLGPGPEGRGRFRVSWRRREDAGDSEEFQVEPGGEIGAPRPARDGVPALDWRTGWRFSRVRSSRETVEREVPVPRFGPDGMVERDPDTGEPIVALEKRPVPVVGDGAVVIPPDDDGKEKWLPKAKD